MQTMYPGMVNSPITEISVAVTAVQTSISVINGAALPSAPNLAVIGTGELAETIEYTGKSGNTLTGVTRGRQGAPRAWPVGTGISRNFTEADYAALIANIEELNSTKAGSTVATSEANGIMAASDKSKLDGITAGAQPNPGVATTSVNGLMAATDKSKLDGIAAGAQVNRTLATQAQAIAGTDNTTDTSPLMVREAIDSRTRYGVTTGSATALVLTLSPAPASLYSGIEVKVKLHVATGTNPTLNVNALGAKALYDSDGARFSGESGKIYSFIYDGANFYLSSGGGGGKLNVFRQSTQPTTFEGVWIKDSTTIISGVVSDTDVVSSSAFSTDVTSIVAPNNYAERGSALLNGTTHVFGGRTLAPYEIFKTVHRYNHSGNTWTKLADMAIARTSSAYAVVNNILYVFGGNGGAQSTYPMANSEKYDPSNNTWSAIANLPVPLYMHKAVAVSTDIYIFGGRDPSNWTGALYKYNTINNTYTTLASSPIGGYDSSGFGHFGGFLHAFITPANYRVQYNIATNSWTYESFTSYTSGMTFDYVQLDKHLYISGANNNKLIRINLENFTVTEYAQPITENALCIGETNGGLLLIGTYTPPSTFTSKIQKFVLTPKSYPANSVIVVRDSLTNGSYWTELSTPKPPMSGTLGKLNVGFNDVHFYGSSLDKTKETYYGNGSAWIRLK